MTKYTLLNRRMSSEIRISHRKCIAITLGIFLLFIWALSRTSLCDDNTHALSRESLDADSLPIIYAVTPTYYRPVQKAELTR